MSGVFNEGVSFGILSGWGKPLSLVAWSLILTLVISKKLRLSGGVLLILLGGGANLLMRVFRGGVWDNIKIPFTDLWINLADILICLGVISYILESNGYRSSLRGSRHAGN